MHHTCAFEFEFECDLNLNLNFAERSCPASPGIYRQVVNVANLFKCRMTNLLKPGMSRMKHTGMPGYLSGSVSHVLAQEECGWSEVGLPHVCPSMTART